MFSRKNKLDKDLKFCLNQSYYTSYRVLIKCKKFFKDMESKIPSLKGNIIRSIDSIGIICANVSPKAIDRLLEYPEIEYICFDQYAILCGLSIGTANGINPATISTLSGKGIGIGLIDSGIYPHPDLLSPSNKIKGFVDLINDFHYPYDDNGHGTAVAGVICGSGVSSKMTFKGVADKAEISCYKAFNATGKGHVSDILYAMQCLINDENFNIKILCLPFELLNNNIFINTCFDNLFKIAIAKGIIPIVPSGSNINGENSIQGIALSPYCITVGGLDTTKGTTKPYIFSSSSSNTAKPKKPNLSAACVNIQCLNSNALYISENNGLKLYPPKLKESYTTYQGTSIACAYMCGVCALLLEHNSTLNLNDVISLTKISCNPIEGISRNLIGEGHLDLSKLFKAP